MRFWIKRQDQEQDQAALLSNKKAFESKANCPHADRCVGYIVNKYEQVYWVFRLVGGQNRGWGLPSD